MIEVTYPMQPYIATASSSPHVSSARFMKSSVSVGEKVSPNGDSETLSILRQSGGSPPLPGIFGFTFFTAKNPTAAAIVTA